MSQSSFPPGDKNSHAAFVSKSGSRKTPEVDHPKRSTVLCGVILNKSLLIQTMTSLFSHTMDCELQKVSTAKGHKYLKPPRLHVSR